MDKLTVKEYAELKGCTERALQKKIQDGKIEAIQMPNIANGQAMYLIDASTLPVDLQKKYYAKHSAELPETESEAAELPRTYEEMSIEERAEIRMWIDIVKGWMEVRGTWGTAQQIDEDYCGSVRLRWRQQGITQYCINRAKLYKLYRAYRYNDYTQMLDSRGGWNKGKSIVTDEAWNAFLLYYLDQRMLSISQCYKLALEWLREYKPEQVAVIAGERTFRRRAEKLPEAVVTMAREGQKAYSDRCSPYIVRMYDDLESNDYWIADNHTMDIKSITDDGETIHRLSLTAFIDARSGVMVGWNITDNPCSQSTILALRHAIIRFGIPKNIYVDNGREFLCYDVGGLGHRKKAVSIIDTPPPVFTRLGITMRNAIVRNAKAKPIERTFYTFKEQISRLFESYCGGTVLERPENHNSLIKNGHIHIDSRLREEIADLIDGVYNQGAYGGAVKEDRGKSRLEVWGQNIIRQRRAGEGELALMLARSSRKQKVSRNGVYLTVCGEKLYYWGEDTWQLQGREVYVRYDPADLDTVRIYAAETDAYICTVPMAKTTRLKFADTPEHIATAMEDVRKVRRAVKKSLDEYVSGLPAAQRIDMLNLRLLAAHSKAEGMIGNT